MMSFAASAPTYTELPSHSAILPSGHITESCLGTAIRNDEISVQYQPQIDMVTGAVAGLEALARWWSPTLGPVPPSRFVPLAESSDLIQLLTDRVLERVLADAPALQAIFGPVRLGVNISYKNLTAPDFPSRVTRLLSRYSVPSRLLTLELTETATHENALRARHGLLDLKSLGINLSIDDFGTGYATHMRMTQGPFTEMKIAGCFVGAMTGDGTCRTVVSTLIRMAADLGMTVVGEGVEDSGTYRALAHLGCRYAQGFWVGRPLTLPQLEEWRSPVPLSPVQEELDLCPKAS